jgi:hypothetical protein
MKRLFNYALKILVLACILSLPVLLFGCNSEPQNGFAIILADTGEVLLTEEDIAAYIDEDAIFSGSSAFRLNESGRQKWNSHLTYQDIPRLNETLFSREFIMELEGDEICRGKFWSGVSSQSVDGILILDSLFKVDGDLIKEIRIQSGYPGGRLLDTSIRAELVRFFDER